MPKAKSRKRDNRSLRVALLQRTPQKYVAALSKINGYFIKIFIYL